MLLFGSRAARRANYLSDYDVLVITDRVIDKELLTQAAEWHIDLHVIHIEDIGRLLDGHNSILLDAVTMGNVLHDGLDLMEWLTIRVKQVLSRDRLKRTPIGWMSAGHTL